MGNINAESVEHLDLAMAYRKAKADLYYSSDKRINDIADYENRLWENLDALLLKINSQDNEWVKAPAFLGPVSFLPKDLFGEECLGNEGDGNSLTVFSPQAKWDQIKRSTSGSPKAIFRLMSKCSVDFHVLSSLWISRVGSFFDESLTRDAYASRVRRDRNGKYNIFSLGSFEPYLYPYREWRDKGINAIENLLDEGDSAIAVTADASGFFHNIDSDFLRHEDFLTRIFHVG